MVVELDESADCKIIESNHHRNNQELCLNIQVSGSHTVDPEKVGEIEVLHNDTQGKIIIIIATM